MRRWRVLLLAAGLGLLVAAAALAVTWRLPSLPAGGDGNLDTLADYGRVPDFALVERSGRTVTLADLRGAVWLANFIYTQCTETCPLQSAEVARLQREFAGARDLRLVSITVDPEHDTAATLAAYAARYGADRDRWLFLTGSKAAIYTLARDGFRLGVIDAGATQARKFRPLWGPSLAFASHGSRGLVMHSSRFVLVDRNARIRAYHRTDDSGSLKRLRDNLRALLAES